MTHPLLIASGLNPVLRYKNRTLSSMAKGRKLGRHVDSIYLGNGKKVGSGFKKDPSLEPEMTTMPVQRRALKFR
jgi:hypothetical protein